MDRQNRYKHFTTGHEASANTLHFQKMTPVFTRFFGKKGLICLLLTVAASFGLSGQTYQLGAGFTNGQTVTTCAGTFYDSGGSAGNYAANENYTVSFCSSNSQPISFAFTAFDLEGGGTCNKDYLQVYDGPTTASTLIGTYCGSTSPGTITSSGSCLTFRFVSNGNNEKAGWAATISCINCALSSCTNFSNLQYSAPVQIADPAGLVGDKWRFPLVMAGRDAIVEVVATNGANFINNIDNATQPTGWPGAWAPEINLNIVAGTDSWIDWQITIVQTGTLIPITLPNALRITSIDVDSDGTADMTELHRHLNPNGYILNNPTDLTISSSPPHQTVIGSALNYPAVSFDDRAKVTFYYASATTVYNIRLGLRGFNSKAAQTRLFAVLFDPCIPYGNPDVNPVTPVVQGTNTTCINSANLVYNTTGIFTNYTWTVTGGAIVSGQGTRFVTIDWTAAGNQVVYITTTDGNGCIISSSYPVVVNANPTVVAAANSPCIGQLLNLTATPSGGELPYTFAWTGPQNFISTAQNPSFTAWFAGLAGTFTVVATDAASCSNTSGGTVSVTFQTPPAKPGTISY